MSNSSNLTHSECYFAQPISPVFEKIKLSIYSFIILSSIVGNLTVLFVIKQNKTMRSVTNCLICNCCVADLLITCLPNVWELANYHFNNTWPMGLFMCKFMYTSVYLSVGASIITLSCISVDRFLSVTRPHNRYLQKRSLVVIIPLIWGGAFLFACPSIWTMTLEKYGGELYCVETWQPPFDAVKSAEHYTVILFMFLYALPLSMMSILYGKMAKQLWKKDKFRERKNGQNGQLQTVLLKASPEKRTRKKGVLSKRKAMVFTREEDKSDSSDPDIQPLRSGISRFFVSSVRQRMNMSKNTRRRGTNTKRRAVKMLIALVLTFAVCWLPVFIVQFMLYFHPYYSKCKEAVPLWVYFIGFTMQYSNSAINPTLYFTFSKSYRKGFFTAFPCLAKKERFNAGRNNQS